jgi:hypothetical protein
LMCTPRMLAMGIALPPVLKGNMGIAFGYGDHAPLAGLCQ